MELLKTILLVLSFGGMLFLYWRDNKKQLQEKLFELKLNAYKDITEQLGMAHEDVFNFVQEYQEFEGAQAEWAEIERKLFTEYFKKAQALKVLFYRYTTLLPENILAQLNELIEGFMTQVALFHTLKANAAHDYYYELEKKMFDFIEECRKDLQAEALNNSVFKRVTYNFYPFNVKSFKKRAD